MRREIEERDLSAGVLRNPDAVRQARAHRRIEVHASSIRHICEDQRGKHFRQRRDLEDRAAVDLATIRYAQRAVGHDPSSLRRADPHDDGRAPLALVHSLDQQRMERLLIDGRVRVRCGCHAERNSGQPDW
jgi:hypothetical protein